MKVVKRKAIMNNRVELSWQCTISILYRCSCENRSKEIGIAWTDLNRLQQLEITQYSESVSYPVTLSFIHQLDLGIILTSRLSPHIILFPNSQKGSRLYTCIQEALNDCQMLIVARKYFDETEGQHLLLELMVLLIQ